MRNWQENSEQATDKREDGRQIGQTMILFALMLVVLVAFIGIAVDVGFGFVRSSQFSAAVDAATLAGVIDLDPQSEDDTTAANTRAWQFLRANGWPVEDAMLFESGRAYTDRGIPEYTITVTWPVETYFMRIFGIEAFPVTHSATAAYFSQAEIYTPTSFQRGHARQAGMFAFGPEACTFPGDPVSPLHSTAIGQPNEEHPIANGVYRFRFRIPEDYPHDLVRVELFDTDSVNLITHNFAITVTHSNTYSATTGSGISLQSCPIGYNLAGQMCVIDSGENRDSVVHNPLWFVRVDETWDGQCQALINNPTGNTSTRFELYYYTQNGQRTPLAVYIEGNDNLFETDLRWVSPGAPGNNVPTESDIGIGTFEFPHAPIPLGLGNAKYVYLDVRTESGNSKNVFDVRAGRPYNVLNTSDPFPSWDPSGVGSVWNANNHVNARNLLLANNPTFDPSGSIQSYALGRMPIQHYYGNSPLNLPLVPVDTVLSGGVIYASIFDFEGPNPLEVEFTIDSVAPSDFRLFARVTTDEGWINAQPYNIGSLCNEGTNCNNEWIWPQFRMGVPPNLYTAGTLYGRYYPQRDAHTWSINITSGRPVLTR